MGTKKVLIAAGVSCLALGLLIGGLIGHFGTKSSNAELDKATGTDQANEPEKATGTDQANKTRKILLDEINAGNIREYLRNLSSQPHLSGSDQNNRLADWIESEWKSYGLDSVKQVKYNILLSFPGNATNRNRAEVLSGTGDVIAKCQEVEKILDEAQNKSHEVVPPFNSYAKAGNVSSDKFYYVNYGTIEDFEILGNKTKDLNGSIVIIRYGKIFRGSKVMHAQKAGAIGVILYNDPADSLDAGMIASYNTTYPNSWYLPPTGVQRGSVLVPNGDPLTPGYPSKDYAFRKTAQMVRDNGDMPNIPTQPMGYEDAEKFLSTLVGDEVPQSWRGGISVTYRFGGVLTDSKSIRIINNNEEVRRNISNVIGVIRGKEEPDRYIIIGNHRDAWMFGATDAGSGSSILLEMARAFGSLVKTGWRPRRSIVFASWDGEEQGIIGSWEWTDEMQAVLSERAVAYLNCDTGVVYNELLKVASSPLLYNVAHEATKQIPHPDPSLNTSLYDAWSKSTTNGNTSWIPPIRDLGSGSDHTGFFHKLGISSLDMYYHYDPKKRNLTDFYPLYHTTYDTFDMVKRFVDSEFTYHRAVAQLLAEMTRNLADSTVIPFRTKDYATRLQDIYTSLNASVRPQLVKRNLTVYLDYLHREIQNFELKAKAFDSRTQNANLTSWSEVRMLNDQMMQLERAFLYPLGIGGRKYIRHVVFAPAATDTYASSAFPGIGDALFKIEDADNAAWQAVEEELTKAIYAVVSASSSLEEVDKPF